MAVGCWQLAIGGWRLVVRTVIYGIFGFSGFVSWQPSVISKSRDAEIPPTGRDHFSFVEQQN